MFKFRLSGVFVNKGIKRIAEVIEHILFQPAVGEGGWSVISIDQIRWKIVKIYIIVGFL